MLVVLLLGFSTAMGGVQYRDYEDSVTSDQATVYLGYADMGNFSNVYMWFHITEADTSKDDSVTVTFQTFNTSNQLWTNLLAFAEKADSDTFSLFKYFAADSGFTVKYPIDDGIRLQLAFTDTNTAQESDTSKLLPIVDTLITAWNNSGVASDYATIDEFSDADSSDYIYIKGYGDVDSLGLFGVEDRVYNEAVIDSVVLTFAGEWVTDTAWLSWCICANDTANCSWAQDTATGTLLTDSALTSYTYGLSEKPDGTTWNPIDVDSLIFGFFPSLVNSGGEIRIYYAYLTVYHEKGQLSPALKYRIRYKFIE